MQPESTIRRAQRLRKSPTQAEAFLWTHLRDRQLDGLRFRRQGPIGQFVVDFACLSHRLIVEADGGVNDLRTFDDERRDAWLLSQRFRVLRFSNSLILSRPHEVLARIATTAAPPSVSLREPPSPREGRRVAKFDTQQETDGMGEVVNLNKVRKARDKQDARQRAATNRVVHGLSRAEREAARRDADRDRAALDGHRREPSED